MSEDIIPTGDITRKAVSMNTPEDIQYWTRKWGITREQLQKAVDYIGPREARVADYLRSKGFIRF